MKVKTSSIPIILLISVCNKNSNWSWAEIYTHTIGSAPIDILSYSCPFLTYSREYKNSFIWIGNFLI